MTREDLIKLEQRVYDLVMLAPLTGEEILALLDRVRAQIVSLQNSEKRP